MSSKKCQVRVSTVEVSSKKCQVRVSYKSVKYECLTRVSSKKCHTRVSSRKCQAKVSYQSVAQQCQAKVSVLFLTCMSAFGFVGFILFLNNIFVLAEHILAYFSYKEISTSSTSPAAESFQVHKQTRLCKFFALGQCTRGSACAFAHGTLNPTF